MLSDARALPQQRIVAQSIPHNHRPSTLLVRQTGLFSLHIRRLRMHDSESGKLDTSEKLATNDSSNSFATIVAQQLPGGSGTTSRHHKSDLGRFDGGHDLPPGWRSWPDYRSAQPRPSRSCPPQAACLCSCAELAYLVRARRWHSHYAKHFCQAPGVNQITQGNSPRLYRCTMEIVDEVGLYRCTMEMADGNGDVLARNTKQR